jgi:hypothetical protein
MNVSLFTKEDVDHVFDNLWPIGQEEIIIMGSSAEKERAKFKSMVNKPWSTGFYNGNGCIALIIMEPIAEMKWKTQFVAVEEGFKANWLTLTKYLRKASDFIIDELSSGKGEIELETISDSNYDWFSSMGFNLLGTDGFIDKYSKKMR